MKRILVLCEGQTEETFIKRILAPHLQQSNKYVTPILMITKKVKSGGHFKGGITSYTRIRRNVSNLLHDKNAVCVTTMLDYYGLPADFPGKRSLQAKTPYERVALLEAEFGRDIKDKRFLPYLMLHEFEAMLFVDPEKILQILESPFKKISFGDIDQYQSPEEINEGSQTHPSARIQLKLKGYRKPLHGPLIVEQIGLPKIRSRCPHFDGWLKHLESL